MDQKKYLFEEMSVPRALAKLALPTIGSQLIAMVYNLADTFFIGITNDPYKIAAATLSFVLVFAMNALSNLFGVGGGTLISRLLGKGREKDASATAAFSFYGSVFVGFCYSVLCAIFMPQILSALGASENTYAFSASYTLWVVVIGGIPSILSMTFSHLLRCEGFSREAGIGLGLGGVINILLDPLFMFVLLPTGQEVAGAAIATCLSNCLSLLYFFIVFFRIRHRSVLSLSLKLAPAGARYFKRILATGIPSALSAGLACVSNMVLNQLATGFGDIELAAIGIVKKIDMLPLNVGMGLCQGMIPLVGYNYAAGNHQRMKKVISTCRIAGMSFAALCIVIFELFSGPIVSLFIEEARTLALGTRFLRICCLATPLMFYNILSTFSIQAMGKGKESLILSACRQGLVNIPLLFLMSHFFGMLGIAWTQLCADSLTMIVSTVLIHRVYRSLSESPAQEA